MKRRQGDNRLNRKMKRAYNPEIERVVKQLTPFLSGENRNKLHVKVSVIDCFRGSYLRHVFNGYYVNKGDPINSG